MSYINNLSWRFATKSFDPGKKVSEKDIELICKAAQLAPTSFGLQPWHIYVISDAEIKKKMQSVSYMQPQVVEAPFVLVFCGRNDIMERIDSYTKLLIKENIADIEKAKNIKSMMEGSMIGKSKEELMNWAKRQAYLALGFALAACSELKIDSCPMEGFESKKMDELLNVPAHINSVAMLAVGYRKEDPSRPKIRFPNKDLFTFL